MEVNTNKINPELPSKEPQQVQAEKLKSSFLARKIQRIKEIRVIQKITSLFQARSPSNFSPSFRGEVSYSLP